MPLPASAMAALQYFRDLDSHDCQAAYGLLTDPLRTRVGSEDAFCIASSGTVNRSVTVDHIDSTTNRAVVTVTVVKQDGTRRDDRVTVVRAGGAWRVSDIAAVSANGAVLFDVDAAVAQVRAAYEGQTGMALITLTCNERGTISATPGLTIACAYTGASGASGALSITVGQDGAYTWSTGGGASQPGGSGSSTPSP